MNIKSRQSGVSLIELMMAVSILAIVLFFGVPNFQSFFENSRARTVSNDLTAALQLARSEAIKRRAPIRMCVANADSTDCGADNTDWNSGWLIINTTNNDVIRAWGPISSNINGNGVVAPAAGVTFASSGLASASGRFAVDVTGYERCIDISTTGRVNVSKGVCP